MMNYKELISRYRDYLSRVVSRKDEVSDFVTFLDNETDWLESPASTRFHMSVEHGLLYHSVGVTTALLDIAKHLDQNISEETCIVAGLFHDVGKVGYPGKPYYLKNRFQLNQNYKKPYIINNDIVAMAHGVRSLYLVTQFVTLTPEEAQAIVYHDGPYIDGYRDIAMKEEPLTLLLHFADLWHATQYEKDD